MCNNSRLLPGAFDEWRYYNPVLDKYKIIKDTLIEGETVAVSKLRFLSEGTPIEIMNREMPVTAQK